MKGQFSRDWSLLKMARNWEPRDIGSAVMERLVTHGSAEIREAILAQVETLGAEDGIRYLGRMPEFMRGPDILESIFLITNIECERRTEGETQYLFVSPSCGSMFTHQECNKDIAAAYLKGFIGSIVPGIPVFIEDGLLVVVLS
ncbi:hypothetical protein AZH53_03010 [Methanomicrobiaceae archaeon CYW5]|uniref:hypothetical protein n=1 Tax=Methanovulcanius yangii TaxID=1789227 RepID=UPI0029C9FE52|nr:hypothetical protein [Methanovulcanius yangii]MBT8507400.1 hypothetical protein [Methanovulcanius yangii]